MHRRLTPLLGLLLMMSLVVFAEDEKLVPVGGVDPSAMGNIHTDKDKNGNVRVKLDINYLANPMKLVPPHQTYVAWAVPIGGSPQLLGELRPDKSEHATLTSATPAKTFDVLVTAEDMANPTVPSSMVVLRGHVEEK